MIFTDSFVFLPILTEILEEIHFFSFFASFYAPFWVKKYVLSFKRAKMQSNDEDCFSLAPF